MRDEAEMLSLPIAGERFMLYASQRCHHVWSGGAIKAKAEIVDGQMTTAPIIYVISNISLMSNLNRGSFDLSDIRPMRHLGDT
jgi:hypothetical protein